mgnify:CR=1 FL=1
MCIRDRFFQIGDTRTFITYNFNSNSTENVEAVLTDTGTHCYLWVASGYTVEDSKLNDIKNEFDLVIYPIDTTYFGKEPNVDNDEKIHILIFDIKDNYQEEKVYIAGYFDPADQTGQNQLDMFYMDLNPGIPGSNSFYATLAHEFQHMIHYNQDNSEETWLNEGFSMYAEVLCGYGLPTYHINAFVNNPNTSLTDEFNNTLEEYGAVFLFIEYMEEIVERQDISISTFTRTLVSSELHSINSINYILPQFLTSEYDTFEKIFNKWVLANYLDLSYGDYGYRRENMDLQVNLTSVDTLYTNSLSIGYPEYYVNSWSANYFKIYPSDSILTISVNFDGYINGTSGSDDFSCLSVLGISGDSLINPPEIYIPDNNGNVSGVSVQANSIEYFIFIVAGADDGGNFELLLEPSQIVPVELSLFNAFIESNRIKLIWITSSETNNYGFEVERKFINKDFQKIGFIEGNGTSSKVNSYSFTDNDVTPGWREYRLKQIDYNGTFTYSNVIEIFIDFPQKFTLYNPYPNPSNSSVIFKVDFPVDTEAEISIYSLTGEKVITLKKDNINKGKHSYIWNGINRQGKRVASGIYIINIKSNKFTASKKFIILK